MRGLGFGGRSEAASFFRRRDAERFPSHRPKGTQGVREDPERRERGVESRVAV